MVGPPGSTGGVEAEDTRQEEVVDRTKGAPLNATKVWMALACAVAFVAGQGGHAGGESVSDEPIDVRVTVQQQVAGAPAQGPESSSGSVIPSAARHAIEDAIERARSVEDHDDIEESDVPDAPDVAVPDDGRVINGDFEGSSVERGHNVSTSSGASPSPSPDD